MISSSSLSGCASHWFKIAQPSAQSLYKAKIEIRVNEIEKVIKEADLKIGLR